MTVTPIDIVLLPHCDLHMTIDNTARPLKVTVMQRSEDDADPGNFILQDITADGSVHFDFFAPYEQVGQRFNHLPTVSNGTVTAGTPGVYLFQLRVGDQYLIGRLQVHPSMQSWWFGNESMTTTLATNVAHAQPSVYARFAPGPAGAGTDTIGDITGHKYVQLASSNPAMISVTSTGRLHGHQVTPTSPDTPVTITGTGPAGVGGTANLKARCVDMQVAWPTVRLVRGNPDATHAGDRFNIVFLAEGFTAADESLFTELAKRTADELFDAARHEPYRMLVDQFNVYSSFQPSQQAAIPVGYRSIQSDIGNLPAGSPFPIENFKESLKSGKYMVRDLTRVVGLPMFGENRDQATMLALWDAQGATAPVSICDDPATPPSPLDHSRVDADTFARWRGQQVAGVYDAPDTFFGLIAGQRPGDRSGGNGVVPKPASDSASPALTRFVHRLYEFYEVVPSRAPLFDPRRHPPERYIPNTSVFSKGMKVFVAGLQTEATPHVSLGPQWTPGAKSAGLVMVIINETVDGGVNLNGNMITTSVGEDKFAGFTRPDAANDARWRHTVPPANQRPSASTMASGLADTLAHEMGHSFNLGDEYEEFPGDDCNVHQHVDREFDNIASLGWIFKDGGPDPSHPGQNLFTDRLVRPDQVKWLDLPRVELAARTTVASTPSGGGISITVGTAGIGAWTAAKAAGRHPSLLAPTTRDHRQQLPLPTDPHQFATRLTIANVTEATGVIVLTGGTLVTSGPAFPVGSALLLPTLDGTTALSVTESAVRQFLNTTFLQLNDTTDNVNINGDADHPKSIPNFKPPCKSYRVIGLFEGGGTFAGGNYRPAGSCKMRTSAASHGGEADFCHVCKWLLVNFIDPTRHGALDKLYPKAKKNG